MRYLLIFVSVFVAGCSSGNESTIDCYSTEQFRKVSSPSFSSYIMNVRADRSSRADVFIQLPYVKLRFEKKMGVFKASYVMTFIIRDMNNVIVQTKEVDRSVSAKTYEESVSPRMDAHLQSFLLVPAEYTLEVVSVDNLSNLRYSRREKFTAVDFTADSVRASSILFLGERDVDQQKISLRPILPTSLSLLKDSLGMFQEIYHVQQNDTITVADTYRRHSGGKKVTGDLSYLMPPYNINSDECDLPFDSEYYRSDSTIVIKDGNSVQYIRFHPLPGNGESNIVRTIIVRRNGTADTTVFSRPVFRREFNLRNSLTMDEMTASMKFIMREHEYDSLMAVAGEQRLNRIRQFWEPRGGNDRRMEYERKIIEANTLFTSCVDGSKTAMGIVYFICGVPDFIDCRGTFMEIWFYNIGERAYAFQFRRSNDKDNHFELTPYSVNESVWQYFVDRWRKKL
jgi:GWxTD domain-containing protein